MKRKRRKRKNKHQWCVSDDIKKLCDVLEDIRRKREIRELLDKLAKPHLTPFSKQDIEDMTAHIAGDKDE